MSRSMAASAQLWSAHRRCTRASSGFREPPPTRCGRWARRSAAWSWFPRRSIALVLLDHRALSGPHLPPSIALDECVGKSDATVERLALLVLATHAVHARHDARVALDARRQLGELHRLVCDLAGSRGCHRLGLALD